MKQSIKTKQGLAKLLFFAVFFLATHAIHCVSKRDASGLPCEKNEDCWGGNLYCNVPLDEPQKRICIPNQSCTQSTDCSDPWMVCCVPKGQTEGAFCRFDAECANTQCAKSPCTQGYTCLRSGKCLDYTSKSCDTDCYAPQKCNATTGKCEGAGCTSNQDCGQGQTCNNGKCEVLTSNCRNSLDCAKGQTCNNGMCQTSETSCIPPQPGSTPPCPNAQICCAKAGVQGNCKTLEACTGFLATQTCNSHIDCPPGFYCPSMGSSCKQPPSCPNGAMCPTGLRCDNGRCAPNPGGQP